MSNKYKYWMIQGIKDKKDNSDSPLCNYDIYPLRSIVDVWYYLKVIYSYYLPVKVESSMISWISWLDNFTLILAPSIEDNKLFRKNGNWYIWDYQKNRRFCGSYEEFLRYLDSMCKIKRSNILWSKSIKNTSKLHSQPLKTL